MGLLVMILGLVLFLGVHTLTTQRGVRAQVIAAAGEGGYKIGYSLLSAAGLALIIWGFAHYRATGWIDVWHPPTALKHIALALMLPAVILVVASYIRGRLLYAGSCSGGALTGHEVGRSQTGSQDQHFTKYS